MKTFTPLKAIYTELMESVSTSGVQFHLEDGDMVNLDNSSKKSQIYVSYAQLQHLFGEPNVASADGLEYAFSADNSNDDNDDTYVYDVALFLSDRYNLTPDEYIDKLPWSIISKDWNSAYEFSQWLQQQLK